MNAVLMVEHAFWTLGMDSDPAKRRRQIETNPRTNEPTLSRESLPRDILTEDGSSHEPQVHQTGVLPIRRRKTEQMNEKKLREENRDSATPGVRPESIPGYALGANQSASIYSDNVVMGGAAGHGFAAEKANHLYDQLSGKDAALVGADNAKNGADRRVDGKFIQTKYCQSGSDCIAAAFEKGQYKYVNRDGTLMQIEVPSDMYEAAQAAMRDRISRGEVPGVSNPDAAEQLVRKGHFTYQQAKNIAKFGTLESLTYDAVNGLKLAGTAMGMSAALTFAVATWRGAPYAKALDAACFEGFCVGGVSWIGTILSAQLGRTSLESSLRTGTDYLVKQMSPKLTAALANAFRNGNNIYGAAAANHVSKLLRGNVATTIVVTAVLSVDDFCSLFSREISGKQAFKNIAKTVSGVAGGAAGAWAGASLGSAFFPGVGTAVGAVVGGLAVGAGASMAANKGLDTVIDDDAVDLGRVLERAFAKLAQEYLLNEQEALNAMQGIQLLDMEGLLRRMHACADRTEYAVEVCRPFIEDQVHDRLPVFLPTDSEFVAAAGRMVARFEASVEEGEGIEASTVDSTPEPLAQGGDIQATSETSAPRRVRATRPLKDRILAYAAVLNDDADVYCGSALETGKGRDKKSKAQSNFGTTDEAVLVADFTVFGSSTEGILITDSHIYAKSLFADPVVFSTSTISNIYLVEEEKKLVINGAPVTWLGDQVTPKMRLIAHCIKKHLSEAPGLFGGQPGIIGMAKEFEGQLIKLSLLTSIWEMELAGRISKVYMGDLQAGMSFGYEGFFDRIGISGARKNALKEYESIKREILEKFQSTRESLTKVNEFLVREGQEAVELRISLDRLPDENDSATNTDWYDTTSEAFNCLESALGVIHKSLDLATDRLVQIRAKHEAPAETAPALGAHS
ncbi:MAG TPA: hypothetical protein VGF12_10105 [Roseateles sp.]